MRDTRPLTCIDYAPVHYAAAGEELPERTKGKFVLLEGPRARFFICSPVELTEFHANIIERFCSYDGGPPFTMNESQDHLTILDSGWTIAGGGKYVWDRDARLLRIGGTSIAYGSVDLAELCGELSTLDTFPGYHILTT